MLKRIYVKNYALINEISIEFDANYSIISGETGAGKSILINSLLLASGEAIDTTFVLDKENPVIVEITMSDISKDLLDKAIEFGVELDSSDITVKRVYNPKLLKNSYYINNVSVSKNLLEEIFSRNIELIGQHENQKLLNVSTHIEYLDSFAKVSNDVSTLSALYKKLNEDQQQLVNFKKLKEEQEKRADFLSYAIDEIEKIDPKVEEENLYEERRTLAHAEKIALVLKECSNFLQGEAGDLNKLFHLAKEVEQIITYDKSLSNIYQSLNDAYIILEDSSHAITTYLEKMDFSEEHLAFLDDRLDELELLKKKYGKTIAEILKTKEEYKEELQSLTSLDERTQKLKEQIIEEQKKISQMAKLISERRRVAAKQLELMVNENLRKVGMENSRFAVSITYQEDESSYLRINDKGYRVYSYGIDQVEFGLSSGPSLPVKSLRKIASGGEISRIMLAIKQALIEYETTQTIIFDEIDTGIGGKTADLVGNQIALLSAEKQIICITHLPQIASYADDHFIVIKNTSEKDVEISVKKLDDSSRITEIARMLSGQPDSESALNHAKELLEQKKQK